MTNIEEIWKDIPGWDGRYQVSNQARVRSLYSRAPRILKQAINKHGYPYVCLQKMAKHGGPKKSCVIHRLVMRAFCGESNLDVDHLNNDRSDARLENLEYVTTSENITRGFVRSLRNPESKHRNHKLTEQQILEIRDYYSWSPNPKIVQVLSKMYKVSDHAIRDVVYRKTWISI